jgi:hypothetical protein
LKRVGSGSRWLACLSALAVIVSVVGPSDAAPSLPVSVVNTSSNPVPATVTNTASSPVPTQNVGGGAATHVGQPASKFVSLLCFTAASPSPSYCQPTTSGGTFVVPSGQAFVMTDLQWSLTVGTKGDYAGLSVAGAANGSAVGPQTSFSSLSDGAGVAAGQAQMTTGLVFPPGASIYFVTPNTGSVYVQGYLVPNQ